MEDAGIPHPHRFTPSLSLSLGDHRAQLYSFPGLWVSAGGSGTIWYSHSAVHSGFYSI